MSYHSWSLQRLILGSSGRSALFVCHFCGTLDAFLIDHTPGKRGVQHNTLFGGSPIFPVPENRRYHSGPEAGKSSLTYYKNRAMRIFHCVYLARAKLLEYYNVFHLCNLRPVDDRSVKLKMRDGVNWVNTTNRISRVSGSHASHKK